MAFWKPGTKKPEAPLSIEVDRDADSAGLLVTFNKNDSLALASQRQRLPIFKVRDQFLYLVETRATVIVIGATGCGKTTQIPQYLHEAGWTEGGRMACARTRVACTQPRRVAAQSVSLRVAEEMGCRLGSEVGYTIRFEDVSTPGTTKVKFVTDGTLIRELMEDPLLTRYSAVMVDEAHERSLATDVLLGLLKKVQRARRDLRLVVASATLEARAVAAFFDPRPDRSVKEARALAPLRLLPGTGEKPQREPALLSVEGRSWPVNVHYLEEPTPDYVRAAVEACVEIHTAEPPGDILVFLTGEEEIERAKELLQEEARRFCGKDQQMVVFPLYAGLPPVMQLQALTAAPRGARKVVIASNVAETSVTIEGVVYVVDCCFAKGKFYDPHTAVEALVVVPAGKAACTQRAGRAGRVRPGRCFRLCTEEGYLGLPDAAPPEMQRSELTGTVLQLKALGIDNLLDFEWLAPPPAEMVVRALEVLFSLGALDDGARLTRPTGVMLADLPLEPMLGKALLCSGEMGCSEEMLTVAATLQVRSLWAPMRNAKAEFDEIRERFAVAEGDHITSLNVFAAYCKAGHARNRWCEKNWLSARALARVADVRRQLQSHLQRCQVPLKSAGRDPVPVLRALTAGFFSHAALLAPFGGGAGGDEYHSIRGQGVLQIHPGSVLFRCKPACVLYGQAVQTDRLYMRDVAAVEAEWLAELAPHFYEKRNLGPQRR